MDDGMKLLPCPFCGGEAERSTGKYGDDTPWHYIECGKCGALGPSCRGEDQEAVGKWNTRAPAQTFTPEGEE